MRLQQNKNFVVPTRLDPWQKGGETIKNTLLDYCLENQREPLLAQWHPTRNAPLTPEGVTFGSHQKIWWQCSLGHAWQAAVYTRTTGESGCPYCAGKRAWPGFNDLASQYPALAAQWHPTQNGDLTPDQVVAGSSRKVWWQCEKGHAWSALVKARVAGNDCPYCASRRISPGDNDLATAFPQLAAQWHPTENGPLTPQNVVAGSRRKVWWQCEKGHTWRASIVSRASLGAGCPVCAGKKVIPGENDLATIFPHVASQWDVPRNQPLVLNEISPYSNRRVWWICSLGHSWRSAVSARTRGCGCPYCAGRKVLAGFNDLETLHPQVAAQWHPTLNGGLTPQMVTAGSHQKIWWICPEDHVWRAVVYSRTGPQKCGCPVCAGMVSQKKLDRYRADRVLADRQKRTE